MSLVKKFIPGNEVNNAMYRAIYSGNVDMVNKIIDMYGLSYSPSWDEGYDLLLTAIDCKHLYLAKLLMDKGSKLDKNPGRISTSVLELAVKQGDSELITTLLDRYSNSATAEEQLGLILHLAIADGWEEVVKILLDRGADVESRNKEGMAPLHVAALRGLFNTVELLLASGADLESEDSNGKTSLFLTVSSGQDALVKSLLVHGANCQTTNKSGITPLIDAVNKCYIDIVKDLIAFGADLNARNTFGQTPLHIACMLERSSLISILLDAGADINAVDSAGMVPCDTIKKVHSYSLYFENCGISFLLGKHLLILKIGGFYLHKKNLLFYDMFFNFYCKDITSQNGVLAAASDTLRDIIKECENQISLMKITRSNSGLTVFNIFTKLKDPLSVITENEIQFIEAIDLKKNFSSYYSPIKNLLKRAKLRNKLLNSGQEQFSFLIQMTVHKLPVLPEEMIMQIVAYLSDEELQQLIHCGEEIRRSDMF